MNENLRLVDELDLMKYFNQEYKKNEQLFKIKIDSLLKDIEELKAIQGRIETQKDDLFENLKQSRIDLACHAFQ